MCHGRMLNPMAAAVRSRGAPWALWARAASGVPPLRVLKANRDWALGGASAVELKFIEGRCKLVITGRHRAAGSPHCLRNKRSSHGQKASKSTIDFVRSSLHFILGLTPHQLLVIFLSLSQSRFFPRRLPRSRCRGDANVGALAGAIRHELVNVPSLGLEAVGPRAQLKALKATEAGWAGGGWSLSSWQMFTFWGETESFVGSRVFLSCFGGGTSAYLCVFTYIYI